MLYYVTTIESLENISVDIQMPVFLTALQIPDLDPKIKANISATQVGRLALSIIEESPEGTLQKRLLTFLKI
jgi:hypothetical protein